jgi:hypothetical protein
MNDRIIYWPHVRLAPLGVRHAVGDQPMNLLAIASPGLIDMGARQRCQLFVEAKN